MNVLISPSRLKGTLTAPPSKSYTHRALICAALAKGKSVISNWLVADDTLVTLEALKRLGVIIKVQGNSLIIKGVNGRFNLPSGKVYFDLHDSGTSLRLLTAVSALTDGEVIITGSKRLADRPVNGLVNALKKVGVDIESGIGLPLKIKGGTLKGGNVQIDSRKSSQYLSALLLVAPMAATRMIVSVRNLSSSPYADITLDLMKKFNVPVTGNKDKFSVPKKIYAACNLDIEGDYSSASYFLALKYILDHDIKVKNLRQDSVQGDRIIIQLLKNLKNSKERRIDMNRYPDLVPVVAVGASFVKGKTVIENISHLRFKESDRISSIVGNLTKMGIKIKAGKNSLTIEGGMPKGAEIETYNDHRIAMSFAVAAVNAITPSIIKNSEVVTKSYPEFWNDFKSLGANITFLN